VRTLTREELTTALAARQGLIERRRMPAAAAVRQLTPLQAQHPPAPYLALAARLDGFTRDDLEAALAAHQVVKTTAMRLTLHLVAADEYPAYAQLARAARLRAWRKTYAHLDEAQVTRELSAFLAEPRSDDEIRERVGRYDGVTHDPWTPVVFARTLLPLVQLPPAGFWNDRRRARFVVHPTPLPAPGDAATFVLRRYLAAFGPAARRDVAGWAGVAQRDFAEAFRRLPLVAMRDEAGTELFDLPDAPLPPASTPLPPRLLAHWDQPMLAYADRARILGPEAEARQLTLSGDPVVTVDGRVVASWGLERAGDVVRVTISPHVAVRRAARTELRAEAKRTARFAEPDARRVEIAGL
jgi:Winged helix DNA-binding domain